MHHKGSGHHESSQREEMHTAFGQQAGGPYRPSYPVFSVTQVSDGQLSSACSWGVWYVVSVSQEAPGTDCIPEPHTGSIIQQPKPHTACLVFVSVICFTPFLKLSVPQPLHLQNGGDNNGTDLINWSICKSAHDRSLAQSPLSLGLDYYL